MKEIIEHGYAQFGTRCNRCQCAFHYELSDIDDKGFVVCPECGSKCLHFSHNFVYGTQIKDDE